MPAAIAIPAILGAAGVGTQLVGAKMASSAAKDAAKLQIAATEKAQRFNEQAYADQKTAMAPYQQAGQQSLGALMTRQQTPLAQRAQSFVQAARPPMAMGPRGVPMNTAPQGGMSLGQAMQGAPPQAPQAPPQAEPTVMMMSPDGESRPVPQSRVQDALSRGARMA